MKRISSDDAVSMVIRMCPDTKAGKTAKHVMCIEMVEGDPNAWVNAPIDTVIASLFETAKSSSTSAIQGTVNERKYGAAKDELHRLLTDVNDRMLVFCETIVHIAAVHEEMRQFVMSEESIA